MKPNDVHLVSPNGIFPRVRSTWDVTLYALDNIIEAGTYANATSWMWSMGPRHDWTCHWRRRQTSDASRQNRWWEPKTSFR